MNSSQQPLITVLMPAYNSQNTIHESIDSVLVETTVPLELVVVDDASTDETPIILDSYAEVDPRVRVFHRAKNGGDGPTRNTGLAEATGEWLVLLDADDILVEGALAQLAPVLKKTTSDVVFTHYAELDIKRNRRWRRYSKKLDEFIGAGPVNPHMCGDDFFVGIRSVISNKVFRLSHVKSLSMRFQEVPRSGDVFFTLGVPGLSTSVEFCGIELYEYRVNRPHSLVRSGDRHPLTEAMALAATYDLFVERDVWDDWKIAFLNWAVRYVVTSLSLSPSLKSFRALAKLLQDETLPKMGLDEVDLSSLCSTGQYEVCKTLLEDGPDAALHALMRLEDSWRDNNASDRDIARRKAFEAQTDLAKQKKITKDSQTALKAAQKREEALAAELESAQKHIAELEGNLTAVWNSTSMRIGRVATFVPRHFRDALMRKGDR